MASVPVSIKLVNGSGMSVGPFTTSNSTLTINASNLSTSNLVVRNYPEPPEECGKRRGGPRSRIYCEVFKCVPHKVHVGKHATNQFGRWYTWEGE
jgi:hypothetical protein